MPWETWQPTRFRHVARVLGTSMNTIEIETDAGRGFLKALGNREGEHALACELIGSSLAEWLGLPTLEFTLLELANDAVLFLEDDDSVPLAKRRRAKPGPAFVSKAITAVSWDGQPADLERLTNPEAIAGVVLLDTWIANPDRHPRRPADPSLSTWEKQNLDNVMLEILPKARRRFVAMDFTVCFHCRDGGLRKGYGEQFVRDDGIYGLFPAFEPYVTETALRPFLDRLGAANLAQQVDGLLDRIPHEWLVDSPTRAAVRAFLSARAAYLVDNFLSDLQRVVHGGPS